MESVESVESVEGVECAECGECVGCEVECGVEPGVGSGKWEVGSEKRGVESVEWQVWTGKCGLWTAWTVESVDC